MKTSRVFQRKELASAIAPVLSADKKPFSPDRKERFSSFKYDSSSFIKQK